MVCLDCMAPVTYPRERCPVCAGIRRRRQQGTILDQLEACRVMVPGRRGVLREWEGLRAPDGMRIEEQCECHPHPGKRWAGTMGGRYRDDQWVPDQRNAPGLGGGRSVGGAPVFRPCTRCDGSGWRPMDEIAPGVVADSERIRSSPNCYRLVPR